MFTEWRFLLYVLILTIVEIYGKLYVFVDKYNITADPTILNITMNFNNGLNTFDRNNSFDLSLDTDFHLLVPISSLFGDFSAANTKTIGGKPFRWFQQTVDICSLFLKGAYKDQIIYFFYELFKKQGKLPKTCPIKPVSIISTKTIF